MAYKWIWTHTGIPRRERRHYFNRVSGKWNVVPKEYREAGTNVPYVKKK